MSAGGRIRAPAGRALLAALTALAALGLGACDGASSGGARAGDRAGERAVLCGTVLDRATGAPLAGVLVELPGGRSARTDEHGRFTARDLEPGASGTARARTDDGRAAAVPVRPLRPGVLEIVLYAGR